jgi:hypothetical protein
MRFQEIQTVQAAIATSRYPLTDEYRPSIRAIIVLTNASSAP